MANLKKIESNRQNAKLSTGPHDSSHSRLNAITHGILSRESLITVGEGREDGELFEQLSAELRDALAPVGALEELWWTS